MPDDWNRRQYPPGTPVLVYQHGPAEPPKEGKLLTPYDCDHPERSPHPEIVMADNAVVLGCECWWIPLEEARTCKVKREPRPPCPPTAPG